MSAATRQAMRLFNEWLRCPQARSAQATQMPRTSVMQSRLETDVLRMLFPCTQQRSALRLLDKPVSASYKD